MAIYKPTAPGVYPNTIVGGTYFSKQFASGSKMQQANNNKNSSSAMFQNLNSLIVDLDAEYDALPDKAPWEMYAAEIAGEWDLCANCAPDVGAKKLFRQVNFNLKIQGLGRTNTPPGEPLTASGGDKVATWTTTGPMAPFIEITGTGDATQYVVQQGKGLNNPIIQIPPGDHVYFPGDALYDQITSLGVGTYNACVMLGGGQPGLRCTFSLVNSM